MDNLPRVRLGKYRTFAAWKKAAEQSRDAKRRRRGRCEVCGAETRYHGHAVRSQRGVSRLCRSCANRAAKTGAGERQAELRRLLAHYPMRAMEVAAAMGITKSHAGNLLHREVRAGRVERFSRGWYRLPDLDYRGEAVTITTLNLFPPDYCEVVTSGTGADGAPCWRSYRLNVHVDGQATLRFVSATPEPPKAWKRP